MTSEKAFQLVHSSTNNKSNRVPSDNSREQAVTLFSVHNILQTCKQFILIWEIIYYCVGGYSVLKFWGADKFSGRRLGSISKQDQKPFPTKSCQGGSVPTQECFLKSIFWMQSALLTERMGFYNISNY